MSDATAADSSEVNSIIEELLKRMGQALNNCLLYGATHALTYQAIDYAYHSLVQLSFHAEQLNISINEDDLLVDGKAVGAKNPFVQRLAKRLRELDVSGFTLLSTLPEDEFQTFCILLSENNDQVEEAGGLAQALEDLNVSGLRAETIKYERVTENEVVINKDDLTTGGPGTGEGAGGLEAGDHVVGSSSEESGVYDLGGEPEEEAVDLYEITDDALTIEESTADQPEEPKEDYPEPPESYEEKREGSGTIQQIMAFLKGEVLAGSSEVIEGISEIAQDAEKLAALIMQAAEIRQAQANVEGGESLAEIVVGCLRRTMAALRPTEQLQTTKGRRTFKKTMMLLEKNVLERLQKMSTTETDIEDQLTEAIGQMVDELDASDLAAEYVKKHAALVRSEQKIIKYIQSKDDPDEAGILEDKLYEAGMTTDNWQRLVVQGQDDTKEAGGAGPGTSGITLPGGIGALALLLSSLDEMMSRGQVEEPEVSQAMTRISDEVDNLADGTRRKIEAWGKQIQREPSRTRELLAEIAQELCQPLSAVNCAVGMTLREHIGEINDMQREVLSVAQCSGQRLDDLLERLLQVVGLPSSLTPDTSMIYKKKSQQTK